MSAHTYNKINIDNISLLSPDKLDDHYICNIKHNDKILYIQTPKLMIDEINDKFVILKINDEFKKFIEDIDNYCIKYTFEKSEEWFRKEIPYDALTNMYENIDTDDSTIRIDFPYIKDKLQCKIYDSEKNRRLYF
jgi:hypothetical protein